MDDVFKPENRTKRKYRKTKKKKSRIGGEHAVIICDKILAGIPEPDKA